MDVIPIAAWRGSGRKAGWWSPFLVAVRDGETGRLQSLCKVMSGFSDTFYRTTFDRYMAHGATNIKPDHYDVDASFHPNVWLPGDVVWCRRRSPASAPTAMR